MLILLMLSLILINDFIIILLLNKLIKNIKIQEQPKIEIFRCCKNCAKYNICSNPDETEHFDSWANWCNDYEEKNCC